MNIFYHYLTNLNDFFNIFHYCYQCCWMDSPGHRQNILSDIYDAEGIGEHQYFKF